VLPQASNAWMFAMFKNFIHLQLLKPFFVPEPLWNSDNQKLSNFRIYFYHSVISPFAVKIFLLSKNFTCMCLKHSTIASPWMLKFNAFAVMVVAA